MQKTDLAAGVLLFALVFVSHALSPVGTSFDSRWTIPQAISLLEEGNFDLNEYRPLLEAERFYAVQCVDLRPQTQSDGRPQTECQGSYYPIYPIGTPLLAAPIVGFLRAAIAIAPGLIPVWSPATRALRDGDFIASHAIVEILVASLIIALAAVALYLAARTEVTIPASLGLGLLFAFCTPAWSTASRALWQHGPSMLMLASALALLLHAEKRPHLASWAAAPLAYAFVIRPTNAIPIVCLSIYVLLRFRRQFAKYVAVATPFALAFFAYNYAAYGAPLSGYYAASREVVPAFGSGGNFAVPFLGLWLSPSRGMLLFTPIVLLSFYGAWIGLRSRWHGWLPQLLLATILCHTALIAAYPVWWGGHSYGPRYLSDLTPLLVILLLPVMPELKRRPWLQICFLLLTAVSFFIHYRGATAWSVYEWNVKPVEVEERRVWDWSDPQMLRGLLRI